ncbi:MAG: hypothetical protein QOJ40_788 [Verrucomicrobiota bacterium]
MKNEKNGQEAGDGKQGTGEEALQGLKKLDGLHGEDPNIEHPTSNPDSESGNIEHRSGEKDQELHELNKLHGSHEKSGESGAHGVSRPTLGNVDGGVLLDELASLLRRFVILPQWAAETVALWILHTYAFQLRDVCTYLGIESPEKRCGKTTLLSVLSELVNRPVVAANISPPAFFRVIEEMQPTLLIDETDTFLRRNDELGGILNAGYKTSTAYVVRVVHQGGDNTLSYDGGQNENGVQRPEGKSESGLKRFSCWCPKAMASIDRLPDTLADRCIIIRMQRKQEDEECERLRTLETGRLKRQCARFVLEHSAEIAKARPVMPENLNDRAEDIWEPLLALADLAGGAWPQLAREAAVGLSASAQESNPIASLLLDIFVIFTLAEAKQLFTRTMVDELNRRPGDRAWKEIRKGRPLTDLCLAQLLRPYGIRPRTIRIGENRAKGYLEDDFIDVFRRYIPRSEIDALWGPRRGDETGEQEAS